MMRNNVKLKSYIFVFIQFLCLILIVMGSSSNLSIFDIGIIFIGLLIGAWAIITMKLSNFNVVPDLKENSKLVTYGPYKYIRHPMYSALLLATLPIVLNNFSVYNITLWIILFVDLLLKLNYEESLLEKRFIEYEFYKKQSKRLIPFIF